MTAFAYNPDETDGTVFDAELVDETPPRPAGATLVATPPITMTPRRRVTLLPVDRSLLSTVAWFVFLTVPGEIFKGGWAWLHGYGRLIWLSTETEQAFAEGKYSVKAESRRKARVRRCTATLIAAPFVALAVHLFLSYGSLWWQIAVGTALLVGMFATGHDWSRRAVVEDRGPWDGSFEAVNDALAAAGVIDLEDTIRPVGLPTPVGCGQLLTYALPGTATWEDVHKRRSPVAAVLAVNSDYMDIAKGHHDGEVRHWIPAGDPFAAGAQIHPLLQVESWNAWKPAPFAMSPRGEDIPLCLVGSNYLGGGKPNSGKSFSARSGAAPFILDPRVPVYCANGKGDPAWEAVGKLAVTYIRGSLEDDAHRVNKMLDDLIAEMQRRYLNELSESKLSESEGLPLILCIIDELQEYTSCPEQTRETVYGKKATLGKVIDFKVGRLAKLGRAAGVVLMTMMQKPDDGALSSSSRDQFGTRVCNKVMTYQHSNMVLGGNPSTLGFDASKLPPQHKGLAIFAPDMTADVLDGRDLGSYLTIRPYLIDDDPWKQLCDRGRALREQAGTLTGHAAHTEPVEHPLPQLLQQIVDHIADMADDERVSSLELIACYTRDVTPQLFGRQLRRWGCPSGRNRDGRGPSGPIVGDVRAAAHRIRTTGIENVMEAA
jgi:S-DNA-T family DNA segregation ATPase FtsK/SpoIIIE